mgnify:CR=1 FL=1
MLGFQDFSQLKRDYGDKEAAVIMSTVGNVFSGQVVGETAKTLSELDLPVICPYLLFHRIIAVLVQKAADFGNRLISRRLFLYHFIIHYYLRMENFLLYCLAEIICYCTDKHSLRKCTDFAGRYQAVQLGADGSGRIVFHLWGSVGTL